MSTPNFVAYTPKFSIRPASIYSKPFYSKVIDAKNAESLTKFEAWKAKPDTDLKFSEGVSLGYVLKSDYDTYISQKTAFDSWKAKPDSDKKYREGVTLGYIDQNDFNTYSNKKNIIDTYNSMPDNEAKLKYGLANGIVSVSQYNSFISTQESLKADTLKYNANVERFNSITNNKERLTFGLSNGLIDQKAYDGLMMREGLYDKFNAMTNISEKLQFGVSAGILTEAQAKEYIITQSKKAKQIQINNPNLITILPENKIIPSASGVYTVVFVENGEKISTNFNNEASALAFMSEINSRSTRAKTQLLDSGVLYRVPSVGNTTEFAIRNPETLSDADKLRLKEAGFSLETLAPVVEGGFGAGGGFGGGGASVKPTQPQLKLSYEGIIDYLPTLSMTQVGQLRDALRGDTTKDSEAGQRIMAGILSTIPSQSQGYAKYLLNEILGREAKLTDVPSLVAMTALNFGIGFYSSTVGLLKPSTWTAPLKLLDPVQRNALIAFMRGNQYDFLVQTAGGIVGGIYVGKASAPYLTPVKDRVINSIFDKLPKDAKFIVNEKLAYSKLSYDELFPESPSGSIIKGRDYGFMDYPETVISESFSQFTDLVPVGDMSKLDDGFSASDWAKTTLFKKGTINSNVKTYKPSDVSLWDEKLAGSPVPTFKGESLRLWGLHEFENVQTTTRQALVTLMKTENILTAKVIGSTQVLSEFAYVSGLGSTIPLETIVTHSNLSGLIGGSFGATVTILRDRLRMKGLTPNQIDLVIPILTKPQTLQTLWEDLVKLDKKSLLIVAPTLQPDMLTASLSRLDPALASSVLTQNEFALFSYILPRLDEKTLQSVITSSDTVIQTALLPLTSSMTISAVVQSLSLAQITELALKMDTVQLQKIIEFIPPEIISKFLPKLSGDKRKSIENYLAKLKKLSALYRVDIDTYSKTVTAKSFLNAYILVKGGHPTESKPKFVKVTILKNVVK